MSVPISVLQCSGSFHCFLFLRDFLLLRLGLYFFCCLFLREFPMLRYGVRLFLIDLQIVVSGFSGQASIFPSWESILTIILP
jgi:hypothetical protein